MKRIAALAFMLILITSAVVQAELTADEKYEIGQIAREYLPGHQVLIEECKKGTSVVVRDAYDGIYYEFYVLAPGYTKVEDVWSRPGYKSQAGIIKQEVLKYLNRSAREMLKPNRLK